MTTTIRPLIMTDIDSEIAALSAHTEAIQVPHKAAWLQPAPEAYTPGQSVWLWDHYNTGIIIAKTDCGKWAVTTKNADGSTSRLSYPTGWLRPALQPQVFVWPSYQTGEG